MEKFIAKSFANVNEALAYLNSLDVEELANSSPDELAAKAVRINAAKAIIDSEYKNKINVFANLADALSLAKELFKQCSQTIIDNLDESNTDTSNVDDLFAYCVEQQETNSDGEVTASTKTAVLPVSKVVYRLKDTANVSDLLTAIVNNHLVSTDMIKFINKIANSICENALALSEESANQILRFFNKDVEYSISTSTAKSKTSLFDDCDGILFEDNGGND